MPRYYTYAPGKAPKARKGDEIHLQPGQTLRFRQGQGYYAGPAAPAQHYVANRPSYFGGHATPPPRYNPYPTAPARPVHKPPPKAPLYPDSMMGLTPEEIDARATAMANAGLLPQQQEVRRQQALAEEAARNDQAAIQGFSKAAAEMEGQIAPQVSQGYHTATQDVGELGQGLATGVRDTVAAQQAQDDAAAAAQGQSGGHTEDPNQLHDSVYALNGLVPGGSLAEQGAAATRLAAGVPQIQLNAGAQELHAAMADARAKNDDFAQQLIAIAAQFPGQKAQALQELNQYELDKANYREQLHQNRVTNRQNDQQYNLQLRAELANEKAAGVNAELDHEKIVAQYKIARAGLLFKSKQAAAKALALGKQIDVPASKLRHHVVYKDGTENPSIPVEDPALAKNKGKAATKHAAAVKARNAALRKANGQGYDYAVSLIGKPVASKPTPIDPSDPSYGSRPPKGRYKARPDASGVFADGTTNDKKKAVHNAGASSRAEAFQMVWAHIYADQLIAQYNYSKEQMTTYVNRMLTRAGWRTTKKRKPGDHRHGG